MGEVLKQECIYFPNYVYGPHTDNNSYINSHQQVTCKLNSSEIQKVQIFQMMEGIYAVYAINDRSGSESQRSESIIKPDWILPSMVEPMVRSAGP